MPSKAWPCPGFPEHAFKRVINGDLKPARASIIGGSGLSHDAQSQLFKLLDQPKNRNVSDATVQNLVDSAHAAGSRKVEVRDLFGSSEEEQSLLIHRAATESAIKREMPIPGQAIVQHGRSKSKAATSLKERGQSQIDTDVTGKLGSEAEAVLQLFDDMKHRDPAISRPLNEAAEKIANGANPKSVHAEGSPKVTARIKAVLSARREPLQLNLMRGYGITCSKKPRAAISDTG